MTVLRESGILSELAGVDWLLLSLGAALVVIVTAVLTSVLTGWLLRRAVERTLRPQLEAALEERLAQVVDGLGDVVQERVRRGVVDGVRSLPAPNLIHETRRSVQRTASDLVKSGLTGFFGPEERPRGGAESADDPDDTGGAGG